MESGKYWVFLGFFFKITLKLLFVLNFTTKNKLTKRKRKKKQLELLSCSKYWQFLCLLQKNQWLNLAHFTIILSIVILIIENIN